MTIILSDSLPIFQSVWQSITCRFVGDSKQTLTVMTLLFFIQLKSYWKLVCVCVCRCWLRVDNYFIWSFIGPVSFIIMVLFSPLCPFSALLTDFVFPPSKKKNAVLVLSNKALLFTYGSVAADEFVFGSNMLYMSGALRFRLDTGTCSHFRNCDFFY